MDKKIAIEIKKIIGYAEEREKKSFFLLWTEDHYLASLQKISKPESATDSIKISTTTGDYLVENIRSLDNSFKVSDLIKELESEGIY